MVLVRAKVILAGASKSGPASKIGTSGLQIVGAGRMTWSKKPVFLKNPPYTIESPSIPQIKARIAFGRAAQGGKGGRGLDPQTGLTSAAAAVSQAAPKGQGVHGGIPAEQRASPKGFHTLAQLESMLGQQTARGGYAPPPPTY